MIFLTAGTTVTADSLVDTLTGGNDEDWFFKGATDVVVDMTGSEQVEVIP